MACENSKKATLFFNYGDGEKSVTSYNPPIQSECIASGNKKTLLEYGYTPGNCPSWFIRNDSCLIVERTGVSLGSSVTRNSPPFPVIEVGGNAQTSCAPNTVGSSYFYYVPGYSDQGEFSLRFTNSNRSCLPVFYVRSISEFVDADGSLSEFKVSDSSGIIYTNVSDSCPTTRIECGEDCPPNTCCECTCNGYKCCYGGNGQPLKRIKL